MIEIKIIAQESSSNGKVITNRLFVNNPIIPKISAANKLTPQDNLIGPMPSRLRKAIATFSKAKQSELIQATAIHTISFRSDKLSLGMTNKRMPAHPNNIPVTRRAERISNFNNKDKP